MNWFFFFSEENLSLIQFNLENSAKNFFMRCLLGSEVRTLRDNRIMGAEFIPDFEFFVNFECFVLSSLSASHWYQFFCSFSKKISKIKIWDFFFHWKRLWKLSSNQKRYQSVVFISVIMLREYASEKTFCFTFRKYFFFLTYFWARFFIFHIAICYCIFMCNINIVFDEKLCNVFEKNKKNHLKSEIFFFYHFCDNQKKTEKTLIWTQCRCYL